MDDSPDLHKRHDIVFTAEPAGQVERAYKILSGLPGCIVDYSHNPNALQVSYSLKQYTLEGLESGLSNEGFHLDHSPLHSISRQIIYYCEDITCHNFNIPVYQTKKYEKEVFINAYDHELHGDHDDTPPEFRDYK